MKGSKSQFDYNPVKGVKKDYEALLARFEETNSVRYEDFVTIWKEMKFPLIFSGRQNERECREFTEEALRILVEMWLPKSNFQLQVGLLYLMYGMYFTQPYLPKCKIRVVLSTWHDMVLFLAEVKSQKHMDVEYIFHTLRHNQAFHFVASLTWVNATKGATSTEEDAAQVPESNFLATPSLLLEILEPDHIDQLSAIHEHYHRMKCMLAEPGATKPQPAMDVIENNLVQFITKSVTAHEEWRKHQSGKKVIRKRRDSGQTTTSESEADSDSDYMPPPSPGSSRKAGRSPANVDHGARRAEIKARAFSGPAAPMKGSWASRQVNVDDSDGGFTSPDARTKSPQGHRKSPKMGMYSADESFTDDDLSFSFGSPPAVKPEPVSMLSMPKLVESDDETPSTKRKSTKRGRGRGKGLSPRSAAVSESPKRKKVTPKRKVGEKTKSAAADTPSDSNLKDTPAPKVSKQKKGKKKKAAEVEETVGSLKSKSSPLKDGEQEASTSKKGKATKTSKSKQKLAKKKSAEVHGVDTSDINEKDKIVNTGKKARVNKKKKDNSSPSPVADGGSKDTMPPPAKKAKKSANKPAPKSKRKNIDDIARSLYDASDISVKIEKEEST